VRTAAISEKRYDILYYLYKTSLDTAYTSSGVVYWMKSLKKGRSLNGRKMNLATKPAKISVPVALLVLRLLNLNLRCRIFPKVVGGSNCLYTFIHISGFRKNRPAPGGKPRLVENCFKALPQPYTGFKNWFNNSVPLTLCPQSKFPVTKF
jgi:hypothetical protein